MLILLQTTAIRKVYVGNLAWSLSDEEFRTFAERGDDNVESAQIMRHEDTLRSKGWGSILYSTAEAAEKAIAILNNSELNGRNVHLRLDHEGNESDPGNTEDVYVGNLPWSTTDVQLLELFAPYKPISCRISRNMYGRSRGFGIVKFVSMEDACSAMETMNNFDINGRTLEVSLHSSPLTRTPHP